MNLQMPTSAHQSLLNSLPGKIAHIYDNDKINSYLKHDIICRLVAKSIGANSVSILLYHGPSNQLFCAGRYIDPFVAKAQPLPKSKEGTSFVRLMNYIDIIEFIKVTKTEPFVVASIENLYQQYRAFEFSNPVHTTIDQFSSFIKFYTNSVSRELLDKEYEHYSKSIREDYYSISKDEAVTGAYYYALTHSKTFEEFQLLLSFHKITVDNDRIIVAPLTKFKHTQVSSDNLKEKLKVEIKPDSIYIGIPLFANSRPIGILRILLNDQIEVGIPPALSKTNLITTEAYCINNHHEVISYIKKTVNIQVISYMLSLLVDNLFFTEGMRAVSLKDSLKGNINNLPEITDELTKIINCFGCIIRLSNSNGTNAEIKGHSAEVNDYVAAIKKYGDPYITADGSFFPVLTDLLYETKSNSNTGEKIDIQCLKTDFDKDGRPLFSYLYLDKNSRLVLSDDWLGILNNPNRKLLAEIFGDDDGIFKKFDIRSIIQIPIKDWKFGFVTFANTSNRTFLTKDVEMLIPVVNRLSLAIKYDSDIAKARDKSRDEIRDSQRVIYHQLLSPVVSLRNSFKYLSMHKSKEAGFGEKNNISTERHHNVIEKKSFFDLRVEEIINTLETTIDQVKVNQFLSGFLTEKTNIIPNKELVSISTFIIEKIRSYQPHAKLHRGLDIHVDIVDSVYPRINTDKALLAHILQALIDNAIKYSYSHIKNKYSDDKNPIYAPLGTPNKIYVKVQYFMKDKEFVISVENWGLNIKNEEKLSLTEYLKRGSNAKIFDTNGTGIGLFVVNIIAEALNGKLEIDAQEDHTKISLIFKI